MRKLAYLFILLFLAPWSCGRSLESIVVTPDAASLGLDETLQFTATGVFSDGVTADISSQVAWSSSDTDVATVNSTGLASSVAAGSTNVQASLGSFQSNEVVLSVGDAQASLSDEQ